MGKTIARKPIDKRVQEFIDHVAESKSENTVNSYKSDLQKFIMWYKKDTGMEKEEDVDWRHIGSLDVSEFKKYLIEEGKRPSTINRAIIILSNFFKFLGYKEEDNPCHNIKLVYEMSISPDALNRKQINQLLRAIDKYGNLRDYAIAVTIFHTGIRVSELCDLQNEDVEIKERSGILHVNAGKGLKYRKVPLNSTARKVLQDFINEKEEFMVWPASKWFFPTKFGKKLSARSVQKAFQKYSEHLDFDVTPHVLRHTFCKSLVDAGESLERVALMAGHSNINTTAKYTKPTQQDLENSVEKLSWLD